VYEGVRRIQLTEDMVQRLYVEKKNETYGSIKDGQFLGQLSNTNYSRKDPTPYTS